MTSMHDRETGRRAKGASGILALLSLVAVMTSALAEPPGGRRGLQAGGGLAPATVDVQFQMNRNRVILLITDTGGIGATAGSVAGGGFWIATSNQYIFSSGVNIGALAPSSTPGTLDTVLYLGGPFPEVADGSAVFPELDVFWDSTDPADAAAFPVVCTVDEFRVAQFPSLAPFQGEPFPGFADQTVCFSNNDYQTAPCSACGGRLLGADIVSTLFAFGVPSVQDFIFIAFRIFNRTDQLTAANAPAQPTNQAPWDLEGVTVAVAIDPDVGTATDDQITIFPEINTMVYWDSDFAEPQFQGPPGFGGVTYLQTPISPETGEPVGLPNFTVFTNGGARPDPRSAEEWYQGMTGDRSFVRFEVQPQDVRGMASSGLFTLPAGGFVEIYAAYFFANVSGTPPQSLLAEDPNLPGANDSPAFDGFREVQLTAQAVFDAGFVVPTAPPKPDLELLAGDGQVTIVWEGDPIQAVNPFAKVARDPFVRLANGQPDPDAAGLGVFLEAEQVVFDPSRDQGGTTGFVTAAAAGLTGREVTNAAFDPDFAIQDFQGFNVYRSRSGLLDEAELIAQFDVADGITGGTFCTAATAVFDQDDGEFEGAVCTSQSALNIGTDSGLAFAVVDRGGPFPAPATGAGLINGIPVFYTVTSFAVNTGQTPVDLPDEAFATLVPPAAPLVLEAGIAPLQQVTPRSNSTALRPANIAFTALTRDGSTCDTDEPTITVDPSTGQITDALDCSNAVIGIDLESFRPENIPDGDFVFVVDSILPSATNPYSVPIFGGYQLAPNPAAPAVWFHWENEGGGIATEFNPAVGSYLATVGFSHFAQDVVISGFDTDPDETGGDANINLVIASDFSAAQDLAVNGQSVALGDLGGVGASVMDTGNAADGRAHTIDGSSLADRVVIGNPRGFANSRPYAGAAPYATGAQVYRLTWSVSGNQFSGAVTGIEGSVVPSGGQPKGPENPSTPADFVSGYNWGFIAPGDPAAVRAAIFPTAGPLTNTITLNQGATFAIMVPGQSAYIEGIQTLPVEGDVWEISIVPSIDRGALAENDAIGRVPVEVASSGPYAYKDLNEASFGFGGDTQPFQFDRGVVNVFPGARWRVSLQGGSNEIADADLSQIRVVPNPFVAANEITRGNGLQRILFTHLPPQATIRIYTISGNLVRVLDHVDGSGTAEWDVRTRFDLLVASGNYYFHVTTPDGRTHLGRFAVVN